MSTGKVFGAKRGVADATGRLVLPLAFDALETFEGLGEHLILVGKFSSSKPGFQVFTVDGQLLPGGPWYKAKDLGHGVLGFMNADTKYALTDAAGHPLTSFVYDAVKPYSQDRLLAKAGDRLDILGNPLVLVASVPGAAGRVDEFLSFRDDFATVRRGDHWAAIRLDGSIAFELPCSSLAVAGHGFFAYTESEDQASSGSHGLLDTEGRVLFPAGRHFMLEPISPNLIKHGHIETVSWETTEATKRVRQTGQRQIWGLLDSAGRQVVPEAMVDVGEESEGLRPFIGWEPDWTTVGYLDSGWQIRIVVARDAHKVKASESFKYGKVVSNLYLEPVERLAGPFQQGMAPVFVTQVTDTIATPVPDQPGNRNAPVGYWIDAQGQRLPGLPPPLRLKLKLDEPETPPAPPGMVPLSFPGYRTAVQQVAGDLWLEQVEGGEPRAIVSSLETTTGFFCGLLAVQDPRTRKAGFVTQEGAFVTAVKYDQVWPFRRDHTWAKVGKQFVILSREMAITAAPAPPKPAGPVPPPSPPPPPPPPLGA
ncbi:MAG: hypothetical protein LBR27_00570 [Bifidobacteriaceae bacterium]|nr:hypothetical protein [Bifidobacteriaceae bacterium]